METLASGVLLCYDKTILKDFCYQQWTVFLMKNISSPLSINILLTEWIIIIFYLLLRFVLQLWTLNSKYELVTLKSSDKHLPIVLIHAAFTAAFSDWSAEMEIKMFPLHKPHLVFVARPIRAMNAFPSLWAFGCQKGSICRDASWKQHPDLLPCLL